MNIERELNKQQAEAVYHYKGPLLVLAGPGSGKTRVITYRVAYLVRNHQIPPDSILAVTFTNKAAQEMMSRLHNDSLLGKTSGAEVWIHTFHAACVRILRQYGEKIGLNPNFAVIDQDYQEGIIKQFIQDIESSISTEQVWLARDFISDAKIRLKDPTEPHESERLKQFIAKNGAHVVMDDLLEVARLYQDYLRSRGALDFDDLISATVKMLTYSPEIRDELHRKFQFIMVDEYQDINLAQYELLSCLCSPERNMMVVADDDQSIYSWRGSDPSFISSFKEQYSPRTIQLVDHFRSTRKLLRASQSLIEKNARINKGSLITNNDSGEVIYHYKLDTVEEELRLVTWLINQLIRKKHYSPGQIAIFYRTHRLADRLEQHLMEEKIDVRRVRRESFLGNRAVRAIVGYLRFICWHLEPDIKKAINFPDLVMDELTKLQLERIAKREHIELPDLLRKIDSYDGVGPLTRSRIRNFMRLIDSLSSDQKEPVSKVVRVLFELLESERNPYHSSDLAAIKTLESSGDLWLAVRELYGAIQQGQPISIVASYGIDNYSAAGIITYVLQNYLDMGERVKCYFLPPGDGGIWAREDKTLYVVIGSSENIPDDIIERAIIIGSASPQHPCIASLPAGEGGVISTTALKLCQRLLSRYEDENVDGIVVYDLETIGNKARTAEIIELAAKKIGTRQKGQEGTFHQLVKPRSDIPRSSTDIHGITNEDVKDKPGIEEVLPSFLDFIGDNILVGHNIVEFDNKVVARYMASCIGRSELPNSSYDTYSVAKRLFPLENCRLEALAAKFGIAYERLHRADADMDLTEQIFRRLRREEFMRSERTSLKEVLPLVALGILEKDAAMEKENAAFYNAAMRYIHNGKGKSGTVELLPISHLEDDEAEEAERFLDNMREEVPPDTEDDQDWNTTRARFQNVVLDFEHNSNDKSLSAFITHAALLTDADVSEEEEKQNKVTMMTAHSAKGTEFDVVIMIGMEQGNFPLRMAGHTSDLEEEEMEEELEEERRLCYVGMTRARKQLYMTSVKFRVSDRDMTPSQFIWEIQPDLIKTIYADQIRKAWQGKKKQDKATVKRNP